MNTQQIRIRLTTEELNELKQLADSCDVNVTALSTVFVKSAIRATRDNAGRLSLPLRFKIVGDPVSESRYTEPPETKSKSRR